MDRFEITKEVIQRLQLKVAASGSMRKDNIPTHCPFHEDKTPSMFLNPKMGVYNCFSCGKSGSVEGLYRDLTGTSLSKVLDLKRDEFSDAQWRLFNASEVDYSTIGRTILIKTQGEVLPLQSSTGAISYLRQRGIPFSVGEAMKMRVALDARINGTKFVERLLIPIYENHNLVSMEGRDLTGKQNPKVLYPYGSSVNTLYDMDNLDTESPLYVVEGLMDLATLRTAKELANSTAIFGAAVTNRQLFLLKRFKEIIVIPDNDKAGQSSLQRIAEGNVTSQLYVLKVPTVVGGHTIKDIGDIHQKTNYTVADLVRKKWLKTIRKVSTK